MMNKSSTHVYTVAQALLIAMGFMIASGPAAGQADPNAGAVKDLLGASTSLGLDWAKIFDETGRAKDEVGAGGAAGYNGVPDFIDWYGGIDGVAIEDKISNGVAIDNSILAGGPAMADCIVDNWTVSPTHDIGNSYMYLTLDSNDQLVVYVGVERLYQEADTFLEIELNQEQVRVASGSPWAVQGGRSEDDLLVRVDYLMGVVSAVSVSRWDDAAGSFQSVAAYGGLVGRGCNGIPGESLFCADAPPIAAPQDAWDMGGDEVVATAPDEFFEIGVNVGNLLGAFVDFTTIQVRTSEDIGLGSFRAIGHWSK